MEPSPAHPNLSDAAVNAGRRPPSFAPAALALMRRLPAAEDSGRNLPLSEGAGRDTV